jgi:hypothetical protein
MADGFGPSPEDFTKWLQRHRLDIVGFRLVQSTRIPSLDEPCGRHFSFRQLIECGHTWERTRPDNSPKSPDTYNALLELATNILDPVIEYFGGIKLTYGFASPALTALIKRDIAPKVDQHSACEVGSRGGTICTRKGAAVDFLVEDEDMREVAQWIAANCQFDRLYLYGHDRPVHVSYGPDLSGEAYELFTVRGKKVPRKLKL